MCGISGYFSRDGSSPPVDLVKEMTNILRHRGPNGGGMWHDKSICFGHRRLSVIDLSSNGHQPMFQDPGVVITYNGEIYNYAELRERLIEKGHQFKTDSDTEVILKSYIEWGADCVKYFEGMFAFGLWDSRVKMLLLARDPLGIKPLHYFIDKNKVIFSSEINALLLSGAVDPELNVDGLLDVLTFGADLDPKTCIDQVLSLEGGCILEIGLENIIKRSYWSVADSLSGPHKLSIEDVRLKTRETILKTLVSDVPIGVFLSGGFDSNIIGLNVAEFSPQKINAFIMSLPVSNFDEADAAKKSAEIMGLNPIIAHMPSNDFSDLVHKVMTHSGEITPNPSFIATWCLAECAANKVKVALSGDGPDELFGGYPTYIASLLGRYIKLPFHRQTSMVLDAVLDFSRGGFRKSDWRDYVRRLVYGLGRPECDRHGTWRIILRPELFKSLLSNDLYETFQSYPDPISKTYGLYLNNQINGSHLQKLCASDTYFYLPNDGLVKMDRVGMAHGLEVRVPYLNHSYVASMINLPDTQKINLKFDRSIRVHQKSALKEAFSSELPAHIKSAKKRGFNAPAGEWINNQARDFSTDILSGHALILQNLFNRSSVLRLLDEHRTYKRDHSSLLWAVIATTVWADHYKVKIN